MRHKTIMSESKGVRLKALNLLENSSLGASALFIPILANTLTGSYMLVGIIAAGYGVTQALSYAYFGRLADKDGRMVRFVRLGFLASSSAFFAHALAYDGLTLLLVRLAAGVATGMYAGAMLTLSHERGNNGKLAGIVSFGSLGWLLGSIASSAIQQLTSSYALVFILAGSIFFAGFMVSLSLKVSSYADRGRGPGVGTSLLHVVRKNYRVYTSFMLRHIGAAATWSIFPIFLNQELRLNGLELGSLYAINASTQFLFMNTVMRRVRSDANMHRLVQMGALLSSFVFLAYYTASTYMYMVSAQILLGVSWSMIYLGSLYLLLNKSNDGESASSTALLESSISISIIIGSLIGGFVAEFAGLRSVMLLSSLLCITSFIATVNWRGLIGMKSTYNININIIGYSRYVKMIRTKYLKI